MSSNKQLNVLIVGMGIAGPVMAAALRKTTDYRITIVDGGPEDARAPIGGAVGLGPNGLKALKFIGADNIVTKRGGKLGIVTVKRGDSDSLLIQERLGDLFEEKFGYTIYSIERQKLCDGLRELIKDRGVDIRYNLKISRIEESENAVTAHFRSGEHITADLVIACDGLHSVARQYVTGENVQPNFTGASVVVGISKLTAEEEATIIRGGNMFLGYGAFFGAFPSDEDHTWAWFNGFPSNDPAGGEAEWTKGNSSLEECKKICENKIQGWEASLPSLLISKAVRAVPLGIYDRPPLPTWHRGRVVLCGDAAHPTTPIGGQGSQMAIESAVILARLLAANGPSDATFSKFASIRRSRTDRVTASSRRGLSALANNSILQVIRDIVVRLFGPMFIRSGMMGHFAYDAGTVSLE